MSESAPAIYCLSGLGVDERAFGKVELKNARLIHVPWIEPLKNEGLKSYAKRLFEKVNPPENYSVMGVSFGGMIAQEWSEIRSPEKCFLISTVSDHKNLRPLLKIGGKIGLSRLMHPKIALACPPLLYYFFGTKSKEDRLLLKQIISDTDPQFLRWAMGAILKWSIEKQVKGLRIHGSRDKITSAPDKIDYLITGAGHFCIFTHGKAISQFIDKSI